MHIVGLDIGGANLKAAHVDGAAVCRSFAVWKEPESLAAELASLIAELSGCDTLAVTMTAELADCFSTKAEGVDFILRAVEQAAPSVPIYVWQTGAEFVSSETARDIPLLVAAANWHALATWVGRLVPDGFSLLIDVGTTTSDIIPILDGVPVTRGLTDVERLQSGELVYSGVRRTPVSSIAHSVPFRSSYCPLAAEYFASTLDVYLLLGSMDEDPQDRETANGRPATIAEAQRRLARAICCDTAEVEPGELESMAKFLADVQRQRIVGAIDRVLAANSTQGQISNVLVAGSGAFLATAIADEHPRLKAAHRISLAEMFNQPGSEAACALAVARLAAERIGEFG